MATKLETFAKANPYTAQDIGANAVLKENARLQKLVGSAVRAMGRKKRKFKPAWVLVADYFGLGSTSAHALCREFGVDPESGKPIEP